MQCKHLLYKISNHVLGHMAWLCSIAPKPSLRNLQCAVYTARNRDFLTVCLGGHSILPPRGLLARQVRVRQSPRHFRHNTFR